MADDNSTTGTSPVNEITKAGKFWAGLLLIILTTTVILLIIAYWPNKMPPVKDGDDGAWYTNRCFNVTLIEKTDCLIIHENDSLKKIIDSVNFKINRLKDTIAARKDSVEAVKIFTDSVYKLEIKILDLKEHISVAGNVNKIHLNTILLMLVALMGFLGNMVHIASSFTTYVGNGSFKRSWILWYFVKPFTAAGLAIIVYFIIRAGFLSYGSAASGISLYGILSLSALAGLFTDSATLKLKEVFEVIFKPKDERTGKLEGDDLSISSVLPEAIPAAVESTLTLNGKNLNKADIKITIDGSEVVPSTKTADKVEIKYTPAAAAITAGKAVLIITDKTGKQLYKKDIIVK